MSDAGSSIKSGTFSDHQAGPVSHLDTEWTWDLGFLLTGDLDRKVIIGAIVI